MVAPALRALLLLATVQSAAGPQQDTLDQYRGQLSNLPPTQNVQAIADDPTIASLIAQWKALGQTDALPFDSYAGFLMAHSGWPDEARLRRAAERQAIAGTGSAASVAAFFGRYPPTSGAAGIAQAKALLALGRRDEAAAAVRKAWVSPSLTPADESYVLTSFPATLFPDDHAARMDALLWAGQTSTAARLLPTVAEAKRAVLAARLALRGNAPDAPSIAAANAWPTDAGFVADRAIWLKGSGQWDAGRAALASAQRPAVAPRNAAAWLDILWSNARAAAADHQWQQAYDIARLVDTAYPIGTDIGDRPYGERDDYTNLAWLGGQSAFKRLGRPADAVTLFDRYARGSRSPVVRSKGFYWAGRAAEAAGRSVEAMGYLADAASYRDQFYGQLAAEQMGRSLNPPPALGPVTSVDPAIRAAFDRREVVRAARMFGRIGAWQDQTPFIRQIATDAKTDTDHFLAADLSRQLGRPDLAVMVGRSALVNGLSDYSSAGFPTVPMPVGYEANFTIAHAIARQESQFDRKAVSHAGARGLMQLMPATAREQAGKIGVTFTASGLSEDPSLSIMLGSSFFQRIFNQYGSYPLAVAAYNAGPGNVNKWLAANGDPRQGSIDMIDWIEAIPFTETRGYVQRVLENAVVYDLMQPSRALSGGRPAPLSWYLGKGQPG